MSVAIRSAMLEDAAAVAAIYARHVLNGVATYDTAPPSDAAFREKIASVSASGWPFLVAEEHDEILGYAYATQFRDRPAYAYACENSIYVAAGRAHRGIGRNLMNALIDAATVFGFRQMVAVIGGADPTSIAFHGSLGFEERGRLKALGWKSDRWLDNVYMQLELGDGAGSRPDPRR